MKVSKKISSLAFKGRGLFWGIFAVCVLVFPGEFSAVRFLCGLALVLVGQAIRLWAAGYIPKYRTVVIGAPVLITWGPYRWVRNPLYAGNAVMGIGWSMMVSWFWVIAFIIAFFVLYSLIVIPAEEEFLEEKFGEEYVAYKRAVPALLPWPRNGFPAPSPHEKPFDSKYSWNEEMYSIRMNLFVTAAIIVRLYFL